MKRTIVALAVSALLAPGGRSLAQDKPQVQELYRAKCQQCHMADGKSPLEMMNFADGKWKHGSEPDQVAKVIADGVQGTPMLSFKNALTPEQIEALAEYVRAFDKALKPGKAGKK